MKALFAAALMADSGFADGGWQMADGRWRMADGGWRMAVDAIWRSRYPAVSAAANGEANQNRTPNDAVRKLLSLEAIVYFSCV